MGVCYLRRVCVFKALRSFFCQIFQVLRLFPRPTSIPEARVRRCYGKFWNGLNSMAMRSIPLKIEILTYLWFVFLVWEFGSWLFFVESDSDSDTNSSLSDIGQDIDLAMLNYLT